MKSPKKWQPRKSQGEEVILQRSGRRRKHIWKSEQPPGHAYCTFLMLKGATSEHEQLVHGRVEGIRSLKRADCTPLSLPATNAD